MPYDLGQFTDSPEDETKIDSDTGSLSIASNSVIGTAWETIKSAVRYKVTKLILFFVFTLFVMLVTGDFSKSKDIAEDMSTAGANDDYFGFFGVVARETGHKSTKLNIHPFYHTKGARELENDFYLEFGYKVKIQKLFAYMKHEGQDFIVMRSAAKGKDKERLDLDNWTLFSMSADDYCEDYFDGFILDGDLEKTFTDESFWRVRKIKNKEGQRRFKCAIGPDTIEDYIEDDE